MGYEKRQSWEILKKFAAFPFGNFSRLTDVPKGSKVVHICGEAYSDYQAFMEEALRSSLHILHTMFPSEFKKTPTHWLCDSSPEHDKCGFERKAGD